MRIISNGSKFYGQEPDTIERLLEVLKTHTLDPTFEEYGDFYFENAGTFRAWGNFFDVSHVFEIHGTAEELEPIRLAIEANKQTAAYQSAKVALAERERNRLKEMARKELERQEKKIADARAVLGL